MFTLYEIKLMSHFFISIHAISKFQQGAFYSSLVFMSQFPKFAFDCIILSVCSACGQLFIFDTINTFGKWSAHAISTLYIHSISSLIRSSGICDHNDNPSSIGHHHLLCDLWPSNHSLWSLRDHGCVRGHLLQDLLRLQASKEQQEELKLASSPCDKGGHRRTSFDNENVTNSLFFVVLALLDR